MNKQLMQIVYGFIPVSVLLMLSAALIVGQARANLHIEASAAAKYSMSAQSLVILNNHALKTMESLPQVIDKILAFPVGLETGIYELWQRAAETEQKGSDRITL